MTDPRPYSFDDHAELTANYDTIVRRFIPGYATIHDLAALRLAELGVAGELLVIGAGGGGELARFATVVPGWRFTAVDPSSTMLRQAADRLDTLGVGERLTCVEGVSTDAPPGPFDAATAFLALFFVADDGARLGQLRAIHARLKPGAPLLMAHAAVEAEHFERDLARYAAHARANGADDAMIDAAVASQQTVVHILSPDREVALLRAAGFRRVEPFFQALWICGWAATA